MVCVLGIVPRSLLFLASHNKHGQIIAWVHSRLHFTVWLLLISISSNCNLLSPIKQKLRIPLKAEESVWHIRSRTEHVPLFLMLALICTDSGLPVSRPGQSCSPHRLIGVCCPELHSSSNTSLVCQWARGEGGSGTADRNSSCSDTGWRTPPYF